MLGSLFTWPFSGLLWVVQELHEAAAEDTAAEGERIREELRLLYLQLERNEISEADFSTRESTLLDRLDELAASAEEEGDDDLDDDTDDDNYNDTDDESEDEQDEGAEEDKAEDVQLAHRSQQMHTSVMTPPDGLHSSEPDVVILPQVILTALNGRPLTPEEQSVDPPT